MGSLLIYSTLFNSKSLWLRVRLECALKVDGVLRLFQFQYRKLTSGEYCWCSSVIDLWAFINSLGKIKDPNKYYGDLVNWLESSGAMVTASDGKRLAKIVVPISDFPLNETQYIRLVLINENHPNLEWIKSKVCQKCCRESLMI